eukprot:CAMPEP_0182827214 /NCGR_PEP_ID=MMETSP0006_2-20121128/16801_1 /TAXON_ID=97485 /ORGANISM="Prymnesium parvum, Strain Texoma1" /LENGTH=40 /DNA_ID= /DNA_START= /DNA_END= /DNA_ORIENTATION=
MRWWSKGSTVEYRPRCGDLLLAEAEEEEEHDHDAPDNEIV